MKFEDITIEKKERREEYRSIKPIFYFSPHVNLEDYEASKLQPLIEAADIIVPEGVGLPESLKEGFQLVANGEVTPESILAPNADLGILPLIYNTNKKLVFIDLPQGHPILGDLASSYINGENAYNKFLQGDFYSAIREEKLFLFKYSSANAWREKYMCDHLNEAVTEAIDQDESLQVLEEVRPLIILGSIHNHFGTLYEDMSHNESDSFNSDDTQVLSMRWRLVQSLLHGYHETIESVNNLEISDENVALGLLQSMVSNEVLSKLTKHTNKMMKCSSLLLQGLDLESIKKISQIIANSPFTKVSQKNSNRFIWLAMISAFLAQGIKLPKSEEEIDYMVKNNTLL